MFFGVFKMNDQDLKMALHLLRRCDFVDFHSLPRHGCLIVKFKGCEKRVFYCLDDIRQEVKNSERKFK